MWSARRPYLRCLVTGGRPRADSIGAEPFTVKRSSRDLLAALTELGCEDWIPVPEAVNSPEIINAIGSEEADPGAAVTKALSQLVEDGGVRIFRGPALSARPDPVSSDEGLALLEDPHWREWGREDNEERLFFAATQAAKRWDKEG